MRLTFSMSVTVVLHKQVSQHQPRSARPKRCFELFDLSLYEDSETLSDPELLDVSPVRHAREALLRGPDGVLDSIGESEPAGPQGHYSVLACCVCVVCALFVHGDCICL
jgi:hypothetical protein